MNEIICQNIDTDKNGLIAFWKNASQFEYNSKK